MTRIFLTLMAFVFMASTAFAANVRCAPGEQYPMCDNVAEDGDGKSAPFTPQGFERDRSEPEPEPEDDNENESKRH